MAHGSPLIADRLLLMRRRYTAPMRQVIPSWALLACGALLASCGSNPASTSGTTSAADPLYFTTTSLPVGYLAENYTAPVTVAGGAGPYSLRVTSGTLPPGLALRNMQLVGTPSKTGSYTFTVEASDVNLSSKAQQYTLNVSELPPLALKPQLPAAEIRGATRIPLNITAPRTVRAARVVWDLPEGVAVTRVQAGDAGGVLFWKQAGRTLTLDLGFKTVPRTGARVALVTVKPQKVVKLDTNRFAFRALDGEGKTLAEVKLPETPATTNTPASGAPSSTPSTAPTSTPPSTSPAEPDSAPPSPAIPAPGGGS
ncbi:Cell ssuface protein containing Ig-like domain [Deinococcus geothermalis DSM 11300]|uniref:Cell ssuface protein containing Ig-like domain n=2 Tax=Deinococcus geothermalis TaxID=68909 RepID=Q1IXU5_DEIGD|nr:Cell ssuface protein containing Ig-like domain [Deinococcus geothermalis DSM 11300]